MWLLKPSTTELYKYNYQFRAVHWYAVNFAKPIYNSSDSVNPLKSLLYAAHHHYSLSSYLGLDFYECLKLRFDYRDWETDRKSTRLNSSHRSLSRMPSSA